MAGRGPNLSVRKPLSGAVTIRVRLGGSVRTPVATGEKPCTFCLAAVRGADGGRVRCPTRPAAAARSAGAAIAPIDRIADPGAPSASLTTNPKYPVPAFPARIAE